MDFLKQRRRRHVPCPPSEKGSLSRFENGRRTLTRSLSCARKTIFGKKETCVPCTYFKTEPRAAPPRDAIHAGYASRQECLPPRVFTSPPLLVASQPYQRGYPFGLYKLTISDADSTPYPRYSCPPPSPGNRDESAKPTDRLWTQHTFSPTKPPRTFDYLPCVQTQTGEMKFAECFENCGCVSIGTQTDFDFNNGVVTTPVRVSVAVGTKDEDDLFWQEELDLNARLRKLKWELTENRTNIHENFLLK